MLGPRVVLQFLSDFIFVFSIEDQQRAAFINQRAAHQNETIVNELIDELRVSLEKSRLGPAEEIARNVFFMTNELQTSAR